MPAPLLIICVLVDTSSTVLWAPTPSSVKPAGNAFFQGCWGIKGHVFRKHTTAPGQGGLSFLKQCLGLGPSDPGDQARSHWAAASPPLCPHSTLGHRKIFLKHSVTPSLHSIRLPCLPIEGDVLHSLPSCPPGLLPNQAHHAGGSHTCILSSFPECAQHPRLPLWSRKCSSLAWNDPSSSLHLANSYSNFKTQLKCPSFSWATHRCLLLLWHLVILYFVPVLYSTLSPSKGASGSYSLLYYLILWQCLAYTRPLVNIWWMSVYIQVLRLSRLNGKTALCGWNFPCSFCREWKMNFLQRIFREELCLFV